MIQSRPRLSRLWIALGALLLVSGLLADLLGIGGSEGLGLREIALIVAGATLVASQVWRDAPVSSPGTAVAVWIWIGLIGGLAEATMWACVRDFGIARQSDHYVWMIPVAYLATFTLLGTMFAVAVLLMPRMLRLPVVVLVPALFAGWSTICTFDWMHDLAGMALAGGIALALSRGAAARPETFLRVVRVTTAAMLILVTALAGWVAFSHAAAERNALAALPNARAGAPNVILIVLDTTRADRFTAYGANRVVMPEIDAFAESGVIFDWAIATAPWTLPAHASIFTGTFPHQQNTAWLEPLDDTHATLAELLAQHGYATAGFVANLGYCSPDSGLSRGFAHYEDYEITPSVMIGSTKLCRELMNKWQLPPFFTLLRNSASEITDRFLSWQSEPRDRPYFAFLNYYDPHAMYVAPPPFDRKFGQPSPLLYKLHTRASRWSNWTDAEAQTFIDGYDACMSYMDHEVGRLLEELKTRGELDETLVIITSDHGELFGENDLQEHQNCLHLALLRVPLIVRFPGSVPAGRRVAQSVSHTDLPATVLDLLDIAPTTSIPGHSLAPLWSGNASAPRSPSLSEVGKTIRTPSHWPASRGDMSSLFLDGLHYIINHGDGTEELYDVLADPEELHDLIESRPEDVQRLRAALNRALGK